MTSLDALQEYFGYHAFREGQQPAVEALLAGRDVLAVMPTGAGKSLCFQLPALLRQGVALVVSPLISLMKDQVSSLVGAGIPAAYLNSSLSEGQYRKALQLAGQGRYKIIYVAPERLMTPRFLAFAQAAEISLLAVDEAHCVSQWGQDFRPSYLEIPRFLQALPTRPVVGAFTATATRRVGEDILHLLALKEPLRVSTGFDRENLYFAVQAPVDKRRALLQLVREHAGESGIVYCATRKLVEEICAFLGREGVAATRYHAGLAPQERQQNQEDFLYDRRPIMVATNAFGMGIDKSNVRYVLHYNMPKDLESYYQEAGRAGRDGAPADCVLLYSGQDVVLGQMLLSAARENDALDEELRRQVQQKDAERLRQMTFYCHTQDCLRRYILRYFGEQGPENCGNCYNCLHQAQLVDITDDARILLEAVDQLGERYGAALTLAVLRGAKSERVLRLGLHRLSCYGRLSARTERELRERLHLLLEQGYLRQTEGEYPLLCLGPQAEALLDGRQTLSMKVRQASSPRRAAAPAAGVDPALFAALRAVRSRLAREQGIPAYMVFSDATLQDMCRRHPQSPEAMLAVSGVGKTKLQRFGAAFLEVLAGHVGR